MEPENSGEHGSDTEDQRQGQGEAVPTVETDSGERQLDPDSPRPAETAVEATEVLEDSVHEGPVSDR